ncbi:MAG: VOC family protein [Acidobacteriota bacterium]|nr:VOC family protein [Acidobacteriota bacterium]
MLDHVGITVSDLDASKRFYSEALEPLGYSVVFEMEGVAGLGAGDHAIPDFWLHEGATETPAHIAFRADHAGVDAFHAAALAAGGTDNGAPGVRAHYHENYYGAYVHDPDGHNVEAVSHSAD